MIENAAAFFAGLVKLIAGGINGLVNLFAGLFV
ncbi:hypothetical protein CAURIC_07860 [Corynebacterium auriscanis]|nr:hypothetical protein CAURIC_07860 [Corynebacterium auriscanis]